jgi:hypothetical protein
VRTAIVHSFPNSIAAQCQGGAKRYGGITDLQEMKANFRANCPPPALLDGSVPDYESFLKTRRQLMASKAPVRFTTAPAARIPELTNMHRWSRAPVSPPGIG